MDRTRAGAYGLLFLLALLWGSSYLFIKVAVEDIPPLTLVAARVTIAAALLLAVLWLQGGHLPRGRVVWGALLLQAFFNSIGAWTVLAWGQQHIDAALASVLNSTAPLFVFFIALAFTRHESTAPRRLIGALLGAAGVILIIGTEALSGLSAGFWGQGAALLGALLYALAAIYGRRFAALGPTATAAGTMVWASVVLVPAAFIFESPLALTPSPKALAATGALGFFCTGLALLIYFRLINTLGPLAAASQAYLRAGIGAAIGVIILGEEMTIEAGAGILLALIGVALINTAGPRRA